MTSPEPYLIAHVVRGQPAFDIAEKMECPICHRAPTISKECDACEGKGFWWIISTSGHRARPYWHALLEKLVNDPSGSHYNSILLDVPVLPEDWPDHYATNNRRSNLLLPETGKLGAADLMKDIGL